MPTQPIDPRLGVCIEEVSKANAEIFTEPFMKKLLGESLKAKWPTFKETQTNEFADFLAQAFISSETIVTLCLEKAKEFSENPGSTQEETKTKYLQLVAFFEYSSYLAEATYSNNMTALNTELNRIMSQFEKKEDPNAELN